MDSAIRYIVAAEREELVGFSRPGRGGVRHAQMQPVGRRHATSPDAPKTLCGKHVRYMFIFEDLEFGRDIRTDLCPRCRSEAGL